MKTFMIMSAFAVSVFSFTHTNRSPAPRHNVMVASAQQEREVSFPETSKTTEPEQIRSA